MWRSSLAGVLIAAASLAGNPQLLPGEGLAVVSGDGALSLYGESGREAPMGSLAKLVWLRRSGRAWENRGVTFTCVGKWRNWSCWNRDGHGAVDLQTALQVSCNLAFLAWAIQSLDEQRRVQGESAARASLEADFGPFLGGRLPPSGNLPALSPDWVGDGSLLRTSPAALARWLAAPGQEALLEQCSRMLPDRNGWWVKTGTAAVPGSPGAMCAWAAGSDGAAIAVLRLPRGRGKREGLARFRALVEEPGP
jgi:hypothetical protein